jgi:hypothetical protein
LVALLEMDNVPLTAPAAVGLNVTETVAVPLGSRFSSGPPFALNPAPVALTAEIDTFAAPASVSVIDLVTGLPTVTLPNATLVVLGESCEVGAVTPVPESDISTGEFAALLATVTVPLALPVCAGSNFTLIVAVPSGFSFAFVPPLALNPVPCTVTDEMVRSAVP